LNFVDRLLCFVKRHTLLLCALVMVWTAVVPFARAFYRVEVDYNEGWNIYNAVTVANHQFLYPVKYGWTTVNYPMLSFALMAQLHRITHEYLFTARIVSLLSLIACSVLVGMIVRRLGGSGRSAALAGMYCLAMFCAVADIYVGMDDPQMLAQMFFLAGLAIYLWRRTSLWAIAASALLFVAGGCIKHNPIDFPLAVLIELILVSRLRAVWFSVCGICFAAIALALNVHFGGPEFFGQLLAPRTYLVAKIPAQFLNVFGPLLIPFCAATYTAFAVRRDESRKIAAILLATTVVVGGYFGGGKGVSVNCLFSAMLAVAILIGLFWDRVSESGWRIAAYAPAILFSWFVIPLILSGDWNPVGRLREIAAAEKRFGEQVAFLQQANGPALCESLLECYSAGKPYVYDPFNATRLIQFGKLDPDGILADLRSHKYGAVQFDGPLDEEIRSERFDPVILKAIEENYAPALRDEDGMIYLPIGR
jgi:hypothetical protein